MATATTTAVDLKELYYALDQERRRRSMSWRETAKELGIASAIFTRLKDGSEPKLSNYSAFCDWLGTDLSHFQRDRSAERRAQARANAAHSATGELTSADRTELAAYADSKQRQA